MIYHGTFLFPESGERLSGRLGTEHGRIGWFEAGDARDGDVSLPGTVTPGLIDAHVHLTLDGGIDPVGTLLRQSLTERVLSAAQRLQRNLYAGITTVRDLGGPNNIAVDLAKAVEAGTLTGSRVVACGHNLTMTGGHGHAFGREADGVDGVRRAARDELKAGAAVLKFMATGGVLTPGVRAGAEAYTLEEMRAGAEEAHKAGKRTAAHAQGLQGIKNALRAGIDTIEHGAFDEWDEEGLELLLTRHLVPTLAAPNGILGGRGQLAAWILDKTEPIAERHQETTAEAYRAGALIVAGTDAGTPLNPHGSLSRELSLLRSVGLTPLGVLQAATVTAADALDLTGLAGTLTSGAHADLVAWDGNPLEDITAYERPQVVVKGGVRLEPADPSYTPTAAPLA
ncbi:MAG: amidohydrolase family protein [Trueperaceae bacterium]|nr:amidohydrolase family protein [Trueperaceae bacterium]